MKLLLKQENLKEELAEKDIKDLKVISQKEFNKIVDNLYSLKINFRDIPNAVLLPNLKRKLREELGILGKLYFTKRRFAHTNPNTKKKHNNQNFRIEEYKGILQWIKTSTYAIIEKESFYKTFMLIRLDKKNKEKDLTVLGNKNYELVGAGVEPAISLALSKRPTTLTSSTTNSNKNILQ